MSTLPEGDNDWEDYLNNWGEYITEELGSNLADNEKKKLNFSIKKLIKEQFTEVVRKRKATTETKKEKD